MAEDIIKVNVAICHFKSAQVLISLIGWDCTEQVCSITHKLKIVAFTFVKCFGETYTVWYHRWCFCKNLGKQWWATNLCFLQNISKPSFLRCLPHVAEVFRCLPHVVSEICSNLQIKIHSCQKEIGQLMFFCSLLRLLALI